MLLGRPVLARHRSSRTAHWGRRMNTISATELAHRVRVRGLQCNETLARSFLADWERRGIARQQLGRWRLTKSGHAMFGGWATAIDLEDDEAA